MLLSLSYLPECKVEYISQDHCTWGMRLVRFSSMPMSVPSTRILVPRFHTCSENGELQIFPLYTSGLASNYHTEDLETRGYAQLSASNSFMLVSPTVKTYV